MRRTGLAAVAAVAASLVGAAPAHPAPIDRHALVERHAIVLARVDPHAPVMLGNGELAFTADITGLQTFPEAYARTAPLLTMAQWAWHSFPNPHGWTAADGEVAIDVPGRGPQPFAYVADLAAARSNPAIAWLRENPHRFSLGRVSLFLSRSNGRPAVLSDLSATRQRLDLWTGTLTSRFMFDGAPVTVVTRVAAPRDAVLVEVASPLVARGRVGVDVAWPGVSRTLDPDPADWSHPDAYRTRVTARGPDALSVEERLDGTRYRSAIAAPGATVSLAGPHRATIRGRSGSRIAAVIGFERVAAPLPGYAAAVADAAAHWRDYWRRGGVVDLSGTADPRAAELERRIVLSQYLSAINEAGDVPPQEDGLFSDSWNGKFHLEMAAWHAAHFATWGRPEATERLLGWYLAHLGAAIAQGRRHGLPDAAWWPKMAGPEGRNSPSPINPFIFWQQPTPIYLAELVRRARPGRATLGRYARLVDATARLLAAWPRPDPADGRLHLGPPIVPVQENHDPFTTRDPAFELAYFRWGLQTAQAWRVARGLPRDPDWDRAIARLAPPPVDGGLYAPVASEPGFWARTLSPACRGAAEPAKGCRNRDHPSFLMTWGLIGDDRIERARMARTLDAVAAAWDLKQLWGWDFPMMAMTAARLGRREEAVDWLLRASPNNGWGVTGMTPRFDVATGGAGARVGDIYAPSNGALLLATGMMAAGWTGSAGAAPGFPADWRVRVEGVAPLP